jgi:ASCH domain
VTLLEAISPTARELLDRHERQQCLKALSIRQPWAWLILHAGKDVENRDWRTNFRGRVLIHAAQTMTKDDYTACTYFIAPFRRAWRLPAYDILRAQCGGIVGEVEIVDCVKQSSSLWFTGEYGFVLKNPKALPFQPCRGALNFFKPSIHS